MDRRSFLGVAGGALALGAGCLGESGRRGDSSGTGSRGADGSATGTPGTPPGTPTADAPYPDYDAETVLATDRVAETAPLYMERSAASGTLPETEFTFTLHNNRDVAFQTNVYDWALHRWEAGRWWRVAPRTVPQPLTPLEGGGTHSWTRSISNRDIGRVPPDGDGILRGLGGGTYAFSIDGEWKDTGATVAAVARFRLEGPQIRLQPSNLVTSATRDGDTYEVRAESQFDGPDGLAEFRLDRTSGTSENRGITEQVLRSWPLRDALAHASPDIETVRIEVPATGYPPFSAQAGYTLTFEGRTYETSARYLETNTATPATLRRPQDG